MTRQRISKARSSAEFTLSKANRLRMKDDGFTLLEVMISMTLIAAASAGLFASFYQANLYIQPQRPMGFNAAQTQMEGLLPAVAAGTTWTSGSLNQGTEAPAYTSPSINGVTYTTTYIVTNNPGGAKDGAKDYRKVVMTTTWP